MRKMIEMKKQFLVLLTAMVLSAVCLTATAQQKPFAERWAANQTKKYTEDLSLSEQQAKEVHDVLLTTAKKAEEIKQSQTGDEQKKALWQVQVERKNKLAAIFTPEQNAKLKEIQAEEKRKKQ